MTDGKRMLVSRYCTNHRLKPESLHYLTDNTLIRNEVRPGLKKIKDQPFVLVASERLSSFNKEWNDVPANHLMLIEDYHIEFLPI